MQIRHFGHSCLLVHCAGSTVLVDPGGFSDPAVTDVSALDAIAVTHQHADHADPTLIAQVLQNHPGIPLLAEPQAAQALRENEELSPAREAGTEITALAAGESREIGEATLQAVGGDHAVIHPDIDRVGNVGLVITGQDEPRLGVTGDSLEPVEEFRGIDALAFAVVAPWSKVQETIDFLREVKPALALPVHDAVASPEGRGIYVSLSTNLAPEGTEVRDWPEDRTVVLRA